MIYCISSSQYQNGDGEPVWLVNFTAFHFSGLTVSQSDQSQTMTLNGQLIFAALDKTVAGIFVNVPSVILYTQKTVLKNAVFGQC